MNDNEILARLMRDVVDDHDIPTPDLLPLARASRRRRRMGGIAGAAVIVVAGTLAVNAAMATSSNVTAPAPAGPTPSVQATPSAAATPSAGATTTGLSLETVTRRCRPQLASYDSDPRWEVPPGQKATWKVAHTDQSYDVGDPVLFIADGLTERLCIVGPEGEEPAGIPDPAPGLADPARLLALCSQELRHIDESGSGQAEERFDTPDLRAGTIVNAAELGGYVTALLRLGDAYYTCDVSNRDATGMAQQVREVPRPIPGDEFWGIGSTYFLLSGGGAGPDEGTPYEVGSGFVPIAGATRMVVDGDFTVDIVDGTYSFVVTRSPKASGRTVVDYLDDKGAVLFTTDSEGGGPYLVP